MNEMEMRSIQIVRQVSEDFARQVQGGSCPTGTIMTKELKEKVYDLLDIEKPKIMVTGVYNAGKSTLINALCKKEVASVADRPETDCIAEYPNGDYLLIDSPGVDAPPEHERITDAHIDKCHMIMFVISGGAFESEKNYMDLYKLIQKQKPFIIVLNKKGVVDENELILIKNKIINNLRKISGSDAVFNKYKVIDVNAQSALKATFEHKHNLLLRSNIGVLENEIASSLRKGVALKMLLAPISNLRNMINKYEDFLNGELEKYTGDIFVHTLQELNSRRDNIITQMRIGVRMIAESKESALVSCKCNNKDSEASNIISSLESEVNAMYADKINELERFIVDKHLDNINLNDAEVEVGDLNSELNAIKFSESETVKYQGPSGSEEKGGLGGLALAGGIAADIIAPIPNIPFTLITLGIKVLKGIFEDKGAKEYEAALAKSEAENRYQEDLANQQIRRRQDIQVQVSDYLATITNKLSTEYINGIRAGISKIIEQIDSHNKNSSAEATHIREEIEMLQNLKNQLNTVSDQIGLL